MTEQSARQAGLTVRADDPVDISSAEFQDHDLETLADLQERCPVRRAVHLGQPSWLMTRYQDLWTILRDWQTYSSDTRVALMAGDFRFIPLETDPPLHTSWRRVLIPLLSPAAMARHEPLVRDVCAELTGMLARAGRFAVMADLVRPLQVRVTLSALLALPLDDSALWHSWAHTIMSSSSHEEASAASAQMSAAVSDLIRDRVVHPLGTDDLVSVVATVGAAGDDEDLSVRTNVVMSVVLGGLESTGAVLAGAVYQIASDPVSRDRITADRSLLGSAVEESLRLHTSVAALQREVVSGRTLHGVALQPGDKVMLSYTAANRDPREFSNPNAFDLDREENRHLAFGLGNHRCLGSNFARLLLRTALDHLLDATPQLALAPGQRITFHSMPTRGIDEFEVVFRCAS